MSSLILDTSAYSAFKRGNSDAVALLRKTPEILVPIIVLGELWSGFEFGSKREANRHELDAFLNSPRVSVVQVTLETAVRYAVIYSFLRRNGRPIPTNDLWIAAMTMEHGATLLTADAHFLRLPQILVSHLAT
ncbi:MAG: type II toxin-antitoxin system VapC family toxin [Chloroflexi bacterium]|nr:type II toxin-antitoxin system VapC family toxin [Chloroflexota bacterium]